ncbi:sensor histidine kinase [Chryseosolibacter indicus]|uniref:histidine kinase n=1 Tax=Chryseosolibacter indicus TaxID=2782351 RepID=A0ABS5VYC9_9BACT|nr:ATP-binding protein [Chryseosolibacter indicus]MBT1706412.1 PAS domain S-box protein [Chryseosolibacter indicus]
MTNVIKKYQQDIEVDLTLFEATPGLRFAFLPNHELTILTASDDMCRFIETDRTALAGASLAQLCELPFFIEKPDLYKTLNASLANVIKYKIAHTNDNFEYKQVADGGRFNEFRWKATSTPVLNQLGDIKYIIFTAEDWDTKAETRLRKTFTIDTVGVIYFDLDGGIHDANPAFERMSGFTREEFVSGKVRWDELTPPEFMNVTLKSRHEFLTRWQNTPYEKQYFRPDGSRWWGLFAGKRLSDNECVEFVLDITPLKTVEEQLEKRVKERTRDLECLNYELLRSNNSLEQFAYAASHDLKEPIRKIQIFADRLRKSVDAKLSEDEKRYLDRMISSTTRMGLLVDDLLSFAHLNFKPGGFEEVNLNELINAVITDLDLEIEERKASIKIEILPFVRGHRRQLQQAFQNIIANALKYHKADATPEIDITVEEVHGEDIAFRKVPIDSRYYVIKIKDNGIGFEQQYADQIFNVFTRLHSTTQFKGTGIGLSIVRKVIESHNGFVTATGNPDEGATFSVYLPISK